MMHTVYARDYNASSRKNSLLATECANEYTYGYMGRKKKPIGEVKVNVGMRVPPPVFEQLSSLAVHWDTTPSGAARRLMKHGMLAMEQGQDREFARLYSVWRELSADNKMHLLAVARSFLKLAPDEPPYEDEDDPPADPEEAWPRQAQVSRTIMEKEGQTT